jgi:GntR family transcriptional regulator, transcriptional repressor for pyruvate dehydrogenase complex
MKKNRSLILPIAKTPNIPTQVAGQIIDLIRSGKMKPGERLPSEEEMTRTLGISRISVREAKKLLEARGYIETRNKRSKFVSMPENGEKSSIEDLVSVDPNKIWELLNVRRILDAEAASNACRCATKKEKARLRTLCNKTARLRTNDRFPISREEGWLYAEFFDALVDSAHNSIFSSLRKSVNSLIVGAFPFSREKLSTVVGSSMNILSQICSIMDAIEGNDPDGAKKATIAHIDYVEKALRKSLAHLEE